jgi:hypothetical protein
MHTGRLPAANHSILSQRLYRVTGVHCELPAGERSVPVIQTDVRPHRRLG